MQQTMRVLTIILIIVAQANTFDAWTYRSWLYVTDANGNSVEWDPCRDLLWFDAQTKGTEPMFAGIETFTSPMQKGALVVPGGGDAQRSDMCVLDATTNAWRLKDDWELFHRDLLTTDDKIATTGGISYQALAKASYGKEPRIPSFSLYHKKNWES